MSSESKPTIQQKAQGQVEVHLTDGSIIACQSRADAELVLDAATATRAGNCRGKPLLHWTAQG
jgi:hypothetical protein